MVDVSLQRRKIYQKYYHMKYDMAAASRVADLSVGSCQRGALVFESDAAKKNAYDTGMFYLKIPENLSLDSLDLLNKEIFSDSSVGRCFQSLTSAHFDDPLLGYHTRINQIEQFLLERRFWNQYLDPTIREILDGLLDVSAVLIQDVLEYCGIPEEDQKKATGGCLEGAGSYHLTFNHYRPAVESSGLNPHKDDGFITMLRVCGPGLEINRGTRWERVEPLQGHLVINFGLAMQILTAFCRKSVDSILHRVARQNTDRISFGLFCSSRCVDGDAGIFQYHIEEGLHHLCESRDLINLNDYEIYEGTDTPVEAV